MTQFMLLQTALPASSIGQFVLVSPEQLGSPFADAAKENFPDHSVPVWTIEPQIGTIDDWATDARDLILSGKSLKDSELGRLMVGAIGRGESFCLFWADDFRDLPEPKSETELLDVVTECLHTDGSWNYDIYVLWRGST